MSNFLKYFNLFSQNPSLRINGERKPSSIFGSIVGFVTVSIVIVALIFILNDSFSHLTFKVNSYIDNSLYPDIDLKKFKLGFTIGDLRGLQFPDHERLFKISVMHWDIYLPKFGENKTQNVETKIIPIKNCFDYSNDSIIHDEFTQYSKMYNLTCLDFNSLNKNLTGIYGKTGG